MSKEQTLIEETFDPFNPPEPNEDEELEALKTNLTLAKGFSLLFAKCNQSQHRARLIAEIKKRLPQFNIQEIHFTEPINHLLDELRVKIAEPPPQAVFVSGLEYSLPVAAEASTTPFIANLNASRNSFSKVIPCPLVLWVPEYILNAIIQGAPDFFSVHSSIFFFSEKIEGSIFSSPLLSSSFDLEDMSLDERRDREQQLAQLLAEYEKLSEEQRDYEAELRLRLRIGHLSRALGHYSAAHKHLSRALELARELGNIASEIKALVSIGMQYITLNRLAEAKSVFQQGLSLAQKTSNLEIQIVLLLKLATVESDSDNISQAEELCLRALSMAQEIKDKQLEAEANQVLGHVYFAKSNKAFFSGRLLRKAENYLKRSLELAEELGSQQLRLNPLLDLGLVLLYQGRIQEAKDIFEEGHQIARKIGDIVTASYHLYGLATILEIEGNLVEAIKTGELGIELMEATETEIVTNLKDNVENWKQMLRQQS